LQNATITPEMTASAAKGVPGFVAENLTPAPTLLPTFAQAPLVTPVPIPPEIGASASATMPDLAFAFFLGGVLVILVLIIYEIHIWKKMKN
jgi:hypothetical protein